VISNIIESELKKALLGQEELAQKALGLGHVDGSGVSARMSEGTELWGKNPEERSVLVFHTLKIGRYNRFSTSTRKINVQIRIPSPSQRVENTPPP
jgi:hypothetical protein